MGKLKITCDSTCDLSEELIKQYDITVLPLYITLGEKQYLDGAEVQAEQIFDFVSETGLLPKTAAVSVGDYRAVWKPYIDDGYEIVHINISSDMSTCYQNASIAAQELGRSYPVDSRNLSSGSGHLVLAAAELHRDNPYMSGAEIAEKLRGMAERLEVSFVVDTLEYLYKGGRCSAVAKLGANLLKLRPCIEVHDGRMGVYKKYRGSMEKALTEYVKDKLDGRKDLQLNRIFITHTHAPAETVKIIKKLIPKYQPFAEIIETYAGCTITSHCGKGTLGILYFRNEE